MKSGSVVDVALVNDSSTKTSFQDSLLNLENLHGPVHGETLRASPKSHSHRHIKTVSPLSRVYLDPLTPQLHHLGFILMFGRKLQDLPENLLYRAFGQNAGHQVDAFLSCAVD